MFRLPAGELKAIAAFFDRLINSPTTTGGELDMDNLNPTSVTLAGRRRRSFSAIKNSRCPGLAAKGRRAVSVWAVLIFRLPRSRLSGPVQHSTRERQTSQKSVLVLSALAALLFLLPTGLAQAADDPNYFELTDAPTITVDWSKGNTQAVTLHGDRTLTFTNGKKGGRYMLVITQDEHGSRSVTLPTSVRWPGGTPPVNPPLLTTSAHKTDYITFFYNGVTYDALALAQHY